MILWAFTPPFFIQRFFVPQVYTLSIGTARGIGGGRPPDVENLRAKEVQRCADKVHRYCST